MKVEEKVLSKHAARRQKKKNKGGGTVVSDYPEPQPGGPIMGEAEPTLDDLWAGYLKEKKSEISI